MKKEIWYSLRNDGAGAAEAFFFESKKLAEIDQDWQCEMSIHEDYPCFADICIGSIELESNSTIKIISDITTKKDFINKIQELIDDNNLTECGLKTAKNIIEKINEL